VGYGLEYRCSIPDRAGFFLFATSLNRLWGPPSLLYNGFRVYFLGIKRPGREADYSPLSSAEVKNMWSYTYTPQYDYMGWCSIKY
jgi:hypothetical protein